MNLGTALAAAGEPTLLIDLDPQGNASTGLGLSRTERKGGSYGLLSHTLSFDDAAQPTQIPHLWIIAAEPDLGGAEIELVEIPGREYRLRDALKPLRSGPGPFGFVLIDCPPSLGLLTLNALVAADSVLVPLQC